jgi:hypothetical protein
MYKAIVSDGENTKDYDLDQFVGLMTSVVDDDLHRIRPPFAHSGMRVYVVREGRGATALAAVDSTDA